MTNIKGFVPIIHNLSSDDPAFNACQEYNKHLGNNEWKRGRTLEEKIYNERKWKLDAAMLLLAAKDKSKGSHSHE